MENKWKPIDYVILIFTVTISVVLLASIINPLIHDKPLRESTVKILGGLVTSIIAIISIYVGSKLKNRQ